MLQVGIGVGKKELESRTLGGGAVYGMGLVGALVYYWHDAHIFGVVAFGLLKAILWPGFLIYQALKAIHK